MVLRRHNPPVLLSLIVGLGSFLSVVPRRHSPHVLLSFIVGLGGFLSVVPRRHNPSVLLSFIVGLGGSWVWSLVDTVLLYYYHLSLAWGGVPGCGPSSTQSSCTIIIYRWLGGGFLGVVPRRHSPPVLLSFIVGLGGGSWVWSLVDTVLLYYYHLSLAEGFPEFGPWSTQSSCTIIVYRWLGGFPECGPSSTQSSCIIIIYRWLWGFPECGPSSTQSSCIIIIYRWLGGFSECGPSSTQSSCHHELVVPCCANSARSALSL